MSDLISGGNAVENQSQGWDDSVEITSTSQPNEPPVEPKVSEPVEESETEEEQEAPKPHKKPKGLVKKLNERESEIERLNAELAKYQKPQPEAKKEVQELKEPNPADFEDPNASDRGYGAYQKALREFDRQEALKLAKGEINAELGKRDEQAKTLAEQAENQAKLQKAATSYIEKLDAYEKENPGTQAKILQAMEKVDVPETLEELVIQSRMPVQMAEYLADNLDQLEAISQMQPLQMVLSLARLEGRLEASQSAPATKRQTQAAPPITPIGGTKSAKKSDYDPNMSQEEFEKDFLELGKKIPRW